MGRATQGLGELRARFIPELVTGARRVTSIAQPNYAALAQACASLEAAVDAVNFRLLEARGLLHRLFRRVPEPAVVVLRRQVSEVADCWQDVRCATQAMARSFGSIEHAERRAFLQIGLTLKDFQPQFSQVTQWLEIVSRQSPTVDARLEQMACEFGHVRLAEARARFLLEELQRLQSTRNLLTGMLTDELGRSLNVWEIRTGELLDQSERGQASMGLVVDLMPKHMALRRLVHKVGATCDQLQHQEDAMREIASALIGSFPMQQAGH
jgi:hypothetical protein